MPRIAADALVGLGLLEFFEDLEGFLKETARHYRMAVLSYRLAPAFVPEETRNAACRERGWKNWRTRAELEQSLIRTGWITLKRVELSAGAEEVRQLTRRLPS